VLVVVAGILLAAEDNEGVMCVKLRERFSRIGADRDDLCSGFGQGDADLTGFGDFGILDDGNAHGGIGSRGRLPQRKHAPAITARWEGAA
jgi:hypothetical protein